MLLNTSNLKFGVWYLYLCFLGQINTLNMSYFWNALNTDGVKNIVNFLEAIGCLHEMLGYLVSWGFFWSRLFVEIALDQLSVHLAEKRYVVTHFFDCWAVSSVLPKGFIFWKSTLKWKIYKIHPYSSDLRLSRWPKLMSVRPQEPFSGSFACDNFSSKGEKRTGKVCKKVRFLPAKSKKAHLRSK